MDLVQNRAQAQDQAQAQAQAQDQDQDSHQLLVLLQGRFLPPEALSELGEPPLQGLLLQAPLAQAAPLLLQTAALLLVPSAPPLEVRGQRSEVELLA